MNSALATLLAASMLPANLQAQTVEAQRLAVLMAYCVSAIASDNVNVYQPLGVTTKGRTAVWNGGGVDGMVLQRSAGDWECMITAQDPFAMAKAAKAIGGRLEGADVSTKNWRRGDGETVSVSACVSSKRITVIANGPLGEAGQYGFTEINDKFQKVRPC